MSLVDPVKCKEYHHKYYLQHKEEIAKQKKEYYKANKEWINEKNKHYRTFGTYRTFK